MKESQKKFLNIVKAGLMRLLKIALIVLKSFFKAITVDFYNNIKTYWKMSVKTNIKAEKPAEKPEEQPKP